MLTSQEQKTLQFIRNYLAQNLWYSQALHKIGWAKGKKVVDFDDSGFDLFGTDYFTDGYRLVLWVTSRPVDIADLEVEYWRSPPGRQSTP